MKNGPYILIIAPEGYPGKKYRNKYAYEHQIVWWKNTNLTVPVGYMIHHINENKHDNSFHNLELISRKSHAIIHAKGGNSLIPLVCAFCLMAFNRAKRNINFKKKSGQIRFYCCRSHQVSDQKNNRKCI